MPCSSLSNKFFRLVQIEYSCRRKIKSNIMAFVFETVENIVGKGGYQHFLLFPQCFQKASL